MKFGNGVICESQVFLKSKNSVAFVNIAPVIRGHCLVAPIDSKMKRMNDLDDAHVSDLMSLSRDVGSLLELSFGCNSTTFAIQDGMHSGQSVPHVHVHIIPRREGDFSNDGEVYREIEKQERKVS